MNLHFNITNDHIKLMSLSDYPVSDSINHLKAVFEFDEAWDGITPLRQLGVQVTMLATEPYRQFDLFSGVSPAQYERRLRLDETVDALRDRFGEDIIRRAKCASCAEGHMMGGLDKARRTGVTKPVPKECKDV